MGYPLLYTIYYPCLAVRPVAGVRQQRLREVGEERLEDAGALVHRELGVVQVDDDAAVEALLERRLLLEVAVPPEEALRAEVVLAPEVLGGNSIDLGQCSANFPVCLSGRICSTEQGTELLSKSRPKRGQ